MGRSAAAAAVLVAALLAAGSALAQGAPAAPRPAWTVAARLRAASHPLPDGAPSVVVHAPAGHDPTAPLELVVFLHGWHGCAPVLVGSGPVRCRPGEAPRDGWALAERHDEAGTDSLLVVPQLSYLMRSGAPGRLAEPGFFRELLAELLGEALAPSLGGARPVEDVRSIVLVAHSAGFEAALALLRHGGVDEQVRALLLMDALYARPWAFARWAAGRSGGTPRRIVSLHTGAGLPARQSRVLAEAMAGLVGPSEVALEPARPLDAAVRSHRAVVARSPAPHGAVPARHLAELLPALGLAPRRR